MASFSFRDMTRDDQEKLANVAMQLVAVPDRDIAARALAREFRAVSHEYYYGGQHIGWLRLPRKTAAEGSDGRIR